MALAKATRPASSGRLIQLKQQLTGHLHQALEETYRLELAMHEQTFVGQSDTLATIQRAFSQEIDAPNAGSAEAPVRAAERSAGGDVLRAVTMSLTTMLASELQMRESEIDEHAQFVDLGLDSISGVTWIRKINEKYQTSIEATKVYSYPTLSQLSRHVQAEAEMRGTLPGPEPGAPAKSGQNDSAQHGIAVKSAAETLTSWRGQRAT